MGLHKIPSAEGRCVVLVTLLLLHDASDSRRAGVGFSTFDNLNASVSAGDVAPVAREVMATGREATSHIEVLGMGMLGASEAALAEIVDVVGIEYVCGKWGAEGAKFHSICGTVCVCAGASAGAATNELTWVVYLDISTYH